MQELADQLRKSSIFDSEASIHLVLTLIKAMTARDKATSLHSHHVARYAVRLGQEMGVGKEGLEALYVGGLLHDIGKIGIPEAILFKPMRLNEEEYDVIKSHAAIGFDTLEHIVFMKEFGILDMVLHHHERFDGQGYPHGLKGAEIPLGVRIMTVADSFEAMTAKRVYKPGRTLDFARNEIQSNKGRQFDPEVADAFLAITAHPRLPIQI